MAIIEVLDFGFIPESVTDPFIMSDVNNLVFCFLAVAQKKDGYFHNCGLAIFRTESCLLYKSGYPNDEASLCSPLVDYGFDGYNISKVKESDWIKEVEYQNRKKWPNSNYSENYEHWVFPFKETTLEILASDLKWELTKKEYPEVQQEMLSWINWKSSRRN